MCNCTEEKAAEKSRKSRRKSHKCVCANSVQKKNTELYSCVFVQKNKKATAEKAEKAEEKQQKKQPLFVRVVQYNRRKKKKKEEKAAEKTKEKSTSLFVRVVQ